MHRSRLFLFALPALFIATACGSSDGTDSGQDAINIQDADVGGGDAGPDLRACTDSTECLGGEACREGFCVEVCSDDNPCDLPGTVCDTERGQCVQCLDDTDCSGGDICNSNNRCAEPECTADGDCPGGFVCARGSCSPIDDIICEPSSSRCEGDVRYNCSRDGTREDAAPCDEDDVCIESAPGSAECLPRICEPDSVDCADNFTASLCNATGTAFDEFACVDGEYCDGGTCFDQVCEPSASTCEGQSVVSCDERGASSSVLACAETEDCAGAALGCSCVDGECLRRTCEPLAQQCVGNGRRACNEAGTAWSALEQCGDDTICLAGSCLPLLCEPGSVTCAGQSVVTCAADGTSREELNCAATGQLCTASGDGASCSAPVCVPDARRCADTGESVIACDVLGAVESTTACPTNQFCADGACLPRVCSPSEGAVCRDGDVFACDERGTGYALLDDCATGSETCIAGACVAVVCEAGVTRCDGELRKVCNAAGTIETTTNCAATVGYCDAATLTCLPQVCTPGSAPICSGGDVVQCDVRGSGLTEVRDCRSFGCDAGACLVPCGDGVTDDGEECDLGAANGPSASCTDECLLNRTVLCAGIEPANCIVLPPGTDAAETLTLTRSVPRMPLDIVFLLDQTGSSMSVYANFIDAWATQTAPSLRELEPDSAFALGVFDGFPCDAFSGAGGASPWTLRQRVTTRLSNMSTAVAGLGTADGAGVVSETISQALYQALSGRALVEPTCGGALVPAFDPTVNNVPGVQDGTLGGVGFRSNSLRVLMPISDGLSGDKRDFETPLGVTEEEVRQLASRMDARVIPLTPSSTESGVIPQRLRFATETEATAQTCAWDGVRPVVCGAGQCCTGTGLAGTSPVLGVCGLSYTGISSSIAMAVAINDGIRAIRESARWDVTVVPRGNAARWTANTLDTACFVDAVTARLPTTTPDLCGGAPTLASRRSTNDIVRNLPAETNTTFDVDFVNSCVPSTAAIQSFDLELDFTTEGGRSFARTPVRILVPPAAAPATTRCGDGIVSGSEQCDDGNRIDGDGCSNICRLARCGDSIVNSVNTANTFSQPRVTSLFGDVGLVCDDGATCPLGSCDVALDPFAPEHGVCNALGYERATAVSWGTPAGTAFGPFVHAINWLCLDGDCLDGYDLSGVDCSDREALLSVQCRGTIEQCDNGAANANTPNSCRTNCRLPVCGDGITDTGEECDDGNSNNFDACSNACLTRRCGNGVFEPLRGEECDAGVLNGSTPDTCRIDCRLPFCGDGTRDTGEACDDGNDVDADGCNNNCELPACGNGIVDAGEGCDDGNLIDTDLCSRFCTLSFCGDRIVHAVLSEQCDDGNSDETDGCDNDCQYTPRCADGDLGSRTGPAVVTGTTVGAGNDFLASCGATANSADLGYTWTAPAAGVYISSTEGSAIDSVLHIRAGDASICGGEQLACNDDYTTAGSSTRWSRIELTLTAGQALFIIVDGYGSATAGAFVLNITQP